MKRVPGEVRKSHERCSNGKHRPSLVELKDMLSQASCNFDDVFIVLDALDECPKDGDRAPLLLTISEIIAGVHNLHLFATSRRLVDIEEALTPLLSFSAIPLQGTVLALDIKMYISCQLATDSSLKKWSSDIKSEIENSLTLGANGMYVFFALLHTHGWRH